MKTFTGIYEIPTLNSINLNHENMSNNVRYQLQNVLDPILISEMEIVPIRYEYEGLDYRYLDI